MNIRREDCMVLAVDYQLKLLPAIYKKEKLLTNSNIFLKGIKHLDVPVMVSQQYTKGLGHSAEFIRQIQSDYFDKITFSCYKDEKIKETIDKSLKKTIVVCGMETHICVLQTVMDLLQAGYQVVVVEDCVGSRTKNDKKIAVRRMEKAGAMIVTYESVLFEMLERSGSDTFRAISNLIK